MFSTQLPDPMPARYKIFGRRRLLLLVGLLLAFGFLATSLIGYMVSRQAIRDAIIGQNLPLTSSNIYSEIQKDLVTPIVVSSTMSHDTFLRDWVLRGEKEPGELARYLREIRQRYGAFSSFFVSEKTATYYTGDGVLKRVSPQEPRDAWYYRVRDLKEDYEINVDPDMANKDALTIFINYRVYDFDGNYIGATGIGLTVDAVRRLIVEYQKRYERTIYFVDANGRVVLFGSQAARPADLRSAPGLGEQVGRILQEKSGLYQYQAGGDNYILNVNYLPELKWYLFVELNEEVALAGIRRTLYVNLAISLAVTLIVVLLTHLALTRYQVRLEEMASTDKLTGLLNRQAFAILLDKLMAEYRRSPLPISVLLADVDLFKEINDLHGHAAGDRMLQRVAQLMSGMLRQSDFAVRWGGEEFLLVLKNCALDEAAKIAEKLRQVVETADYGAGDLRITISVGVAQYDGGETPAHAIGRADAALYAAKRAGRNCVHVAGDAAV